MDEDFKRRRRTRVGGPSPQGRLLRAVALIGALVLAALVLAASLDVPPPEAWPAESNLPTTPAAPAAPRLYLVGTHVESSVAGGWREYRRLAVLAPATHQVAYSLDAVHDAVLSADGSRLYALAGNRLTALESATKKTLWSLALAPLDLTNDHSPPLLALTPDEKTLLIYRQEVDSYANTARAWIEQVDVGTHQHNARNISIATPQSVDTLFVAADGHTLFLAGYNAISVIDRRDGGQKQLPIAQLSGLDLHTVMSADRLRLYVVNSTGRIVEYDTLSQREIRRLRLQNRDFEPVGASAAIASGPHSDRLALLVNRRGDPAVVRGERVETSAGQALIVVSLDDGALVRRNDRANYPQALAWSGDGETIYFVEYGHVYRWELGADRVHPVQPLGNDDTVTRLLLGPSLPLQVPPATPTPADSQPPPPPTPAATPTPLVQPDLAPLAWLWPLNDEQQSVVEFSRDGSSRTIADHVRQIIPRPQQPPLLLLIPDPNHWALFDPATGISTTLEIAPVRAFFSAPTFLLSPDGTSLAFVTSHDPKPDDELLADRQLVVVDLATGAVAIVIDAGRWDQIVYGQLLEWAADGIYLSSTLSALSRGDDPRAIWRIDPAAAEPEPELLLAVEERGANLQLNAAAGLLLYAPYPADLNDSSLRLRDLRTGTEQILLEHGPFISRREMQIAPDGRFVAFLRPGQNRSEAELNVYNVQTRTTEQIYSGPYQSWPYALRWSSAGTQLHLHTGQPGFPQGVEQELVWTLGAGWQAPPTRWMLPSGGLMPPPEQPGIELVTAGRSLSLALFENYALLQEYSAQPAPQLRVSLPLPSPWDQSSAALQLRRDTRIVYVP